MPDRVSFYLAGAAALFLSACATGASVSGAADAGAERDPRFGECPEEDRAAPDSVCAIFAAPLRPAEPGGEKIDIFVRKFPAQTERVGEFWMLSGGPGESGASFYTRIEDFQARFPGYDVFIPDHRGTGRSARLCEGETVQSAAGSQLAGQEFGPCFGEVWQNAERTKAFSMTNAAYDLDRLIAEIGGSGPRYVYGISYGTGLALRFGQLHQERVDGLVLDSLVSALDDTDHDLSRRSHTVDAVGREVLAECAAAPSCNDRFADGVEAAYASLLEDIGEGGIAAENIPNGDIKLTLGAMLDHPQARALIPDLIDAAIEDPHSLKGFYSERVEPLFAPLQVIGEYEGADFSIVLASLIGESETNRRPDMTAEQVAAEEAALWFTSSLPRTQTLGNVPTYERDEWFDEPYIGLPPVLVVHGALDPKTPLEGARRHIAAIDEGAEVELTVVERMPHAIWFFGADCLYTSIDAFISGEGAPATCRPQAAD